MLISDWSSDVCSSDLAGTVSFAAGQTSKTLTVLVKGESVFEANESFTVTLSSPSGDGTIATGSANGTIINDDAAPQPPAYAIAALDAVKAEGDAGSSAFTFTVTRSGDSAEARSEEHTSELQPQMPTSNAVFCL